MKSLDGLRIVPGVRSVALQRRTAPFGGFERVADVRNSASAPPVSAILCSSAASICSRHRLDPVLRSGRALSALEVEQPHHVAVVNETFAKQILRRSGPLGRTVRLLAAVDASRFPLPIRRSSSSVSFATSQSGAPRAARAAGLRAVHCSARSRGLVDLDRRTTPTARCVDAAAPRDSVARSRRLRWSIQPSRFET